jgi:phage shock protein A
MPDRRIVHVKRTGSKQSTQSPQNSVQSQGTLGSRRTVRVKRDSKAALMLSIINQNQALLEHVVEEKNKLMRNKAALQRKVESLEAQLKIMKQTRARLARGNNNNSIGTNNLLKRYNRLYAHGVL